jgi:hypothetical protein
MPAAPCWPWLLTCAITNGGSRARVCVCVCVCSHSDWIDGLETFIKQIMHKGWLGGWLMPQVRVQCTGSSVRVYGALLHAFVLAYRFGALADWNWPDVPGQCCF